MVGLAFVLAHRAMGSGWPDLGVSCPVIAVRATGAVSRRDRLPQAATNDFTAVTDGVAAACGITKATTWRVRRHRATHSQRLWPRRPTQDQTSSNSSWSSVRAGTSVAARLTAAAAFFRANWLKFAAAPQRCVRCRAYWGVHSRLR